MFLPLLEDFEVAGRYRWGSTCLAWLYRQLCRASHIDTLDISDPLILLQLWVWERFLFIAPHHLHIAPHDERCLHLYGPFGMYYDITTYFTIMRIHA